MSGTPPAETIPSIFFAQMNFLNPGMLGSIEFFRQEFAVPIDKFGEQDRKDHLRKLLYPFHIKEDQGTSGKGFAGKKQRPSCSAKWRTNSGKCTMPTATTTGIRFLGTIETQGIQAIPAHHPAKA